MFYAPVGRTRRAHDFWPTPPELTRALIVGLGRLKLDIPRPAFDPCAGNGALLSALSEQGIPGFGSDFLEELKPRLRT